MQTLNILDEYILSSYAHGQHKIAIVGNGGIDSSDQENIDKCNVVIRFNNFATREGIVKTTDPFKCNILFSSFDQHSSGANPRDVVIGIPFPFNAEEIDRKVGAWYPRSNCWMVNPYENLKMNRELYFKGNGTEHPFATMGFTALWHLRNWQAVFYVCGFNWYSDLEKLTLDGHPVKSLAFARKNHNYTLELRWIINNLVPKNNFIFSDSCYKIIETFSHVLRK